MKQFKKKIGITLGRSSVGLARQQQILHGCFQSESNGFQEAVRDLSTPPGDPKQAARHKVRVFPKGLKAELKAAFTNGKEIRLMKFKLLRD